MDFRNIGFLDQALLSALHDMMDFTDDIPSTGSGDRTQSAPSKAYIRDAKAMARTPADIKEYPNAYQFTVDMPGVSAGEVKVQLNEDDGLLVVSGERKREKEGKEKEGSAEDGGGVKYLRMERRMGKFMRKFTLPENANREKISAVCRDGVVTVTVEKLPPPEPKKPKSIQVQVA